MSKHAPSRTGLVGPRSAWAATLALCLLAALASGGFALAQPRGLAVEGNELNAMRQEGRVALVVGNGAYRANPLCNPARDAQAVAAALRRVGFRVSEVRDVDRDALRRAVLDFGKALERDKGVGLFYFAGHAVEVEGANYLLPIGALAKLRDDRYVPVEAVALDEVMRAMDESGARVKIAILDACRNNPLPSRTRSAQGGLAPVSGARGTFVAFATEPHRTALDGEGQHSTYTEALLRHLETPGLRIEDVFKRVRDDVSSRTNEGQMPTENTKLVGDFFFALPESALPESSRKIDSPVVLSPRPNPRATTPRDSLQTPAIECPQLHHIPLVQPADPAHVAAADVSVIHAILLREGWAFREQSQDGRILLYTKAFLLLTVDTHELSNRVPLHEYRSDATTSVYTECALAWPPTE